MIHRDGSKGKVEQIVLLVDNIPTVLQSSADKLSRRGYTVYPASTPEEALAVIDQKRIHLIIVDNRLRDDTDVTDFSGFELVNDERLKSFTRCIYAFEAEPVVHKRWRDFVGTELPGNVEIFSKKEHKIEDIVDGAFQWPKAQPDAWSVGINFELQKHINYDRGLTPLVLVESLKGAPEDLMRKGMLAGEFADLFSRAFADYDSLVIGMRARGGGGSLVLLITPMRGDYPDVPLIIKCGWLNNIKHEQENYRNHVMRRNPGRTAHLVEDQVYETQHFGLIKYLVAGENVWRTRTFSDFYRQQANTEDITRAIEHVFGVATEAWHQPIAERREGEYLNRFYEQRLLRGRAGPASLSSEEMWANVGTAVQRVITQARRQGLLASGTASMPSMLPWRIGGRTYETPEPFQYLSQLRDQESTLFPRNYVTSQGHGDLHGDNILVDEDTDTWLIDFEYTGWGPILQDPVELESSIHFRLLDENRPERVLQLEAALGSHTMFTDPVPPPAELSAPHYETLRKAYTVILALRSIAGNIGDARPEDYLLGLIYHGLRVVIDDRPQLTADLRPPWFFQVQALCLASFCCRQLAAIDSARRS
ncbi:MAG: phosphotransferase [Chloroflexota bacterium]|nr:phosphotransferase [Chloroflexota bacterium]